MKKVTVFAVAAFIGFAPVSGYAGFQFNAPQESAQSVITPPIVSGEQNMMPAVPAIRVEKAPVQPIIQSQPQSMPRAPQIAPRPMAPKPVVSKPRTQNDLAVGFGNDLPLATALKQVLPENYTYILDQNIGVGQKVSWNGGQPWPIVINNMIAPLGLKSQIDGKIVRILGAQQPVMTPQPITQQMSRPVMPRPVTPTAPGIVWDSPSSPVSAPTSILAPQLKSQAISKITTETKAVEDETKSIVPDVTQGQWMAQKGNSLKTVLESWSNIEGVDLFWSADYDFVLAGDANISGNFEEAIEELLAGFNDSKPKPMGRLHPNLPHGPAVLVIETSENS